MWGKILIEGGRRSHSIPFRIINTAKKTKKTIMFIPVIFDQPHWSSSTADWWCWPWLKFMTFRMCDPKTGSKTFGRLYRPLPLLSTGLWALMYITSLMPLSKYLGSLSKILTLSKSTVYPGDSMWMCWETSDLVKLGCRCSLMKRVFTFLSVSPM